MDIGTLVASIGADISDLKRGVKQTQDEMKKVSKSVDKELDKADARWKKSEKAVQAYENKVKAELIATQKDMANYVAKVEREFRQAEYAIKLYAEKTERELKEATKAVQDYERKVKTELKQAARDLTTYGNKTKSTLNRVDSRWNRSGRNINGITKTIKSAVLGYITVLATMQGATFIKDLVRTGTELDSLNRSFKAITGSAEAAAQQLTFVQKVSKDLGLALLPMEQGYKNILAASKGTTLEGKGVQKVFLAVSQASAALGLSADDTTGTLRALSQMMSKGNVQAEELRGQLGERLPGAFIMAAEAMGVTTKELNKMLELGQVTAEEMLPKLADVLTNRFAKAAIEAIEGPRAAFQEFSNTILKLQRTLSTSGIVDLMESIARDATSFLEDFTRNIEANEKDIGEYLGSIEESFHTFFQNLDPKDIVQKLEFFFNLLSDGAEIVGNFIDVWTSIPEGYKGPLFTALVGLINPMAGVVTGLALLTPAIKDFFTANVALMEGGMSLGDFISISDGDFEKALDHWRELQALTDGVIETEEELEAAIELTRIQLNKELNSPFSVYQKEQQESIRLIIELRKKLKEYIALLPRGVQSQKSVDIYKNLNRLHEESNGLQTIHNKRVRQSVNMYKGIKQLQEDINKAIEAGKKAQTERNKQVQHSVDMYRAIRQLQGETDRANAKTFDADIKSIKSYSSTPYELEMQAAEDAYIVVKDKITKQITDTLELTAARKTAEDTYLAIVKDINQKIVNDTKAANQKIVNDRIKAQEEIINYINKNTKTSFQNEILEAKKKYDEMTAKAEEYGMDLTAIDEAYYARLRELADAESSRKEKEREKELSTEQKQIADIAKLWIKEDADRIKAEDKAWDKKVAIAQKAIDKQEKLWDNMLSNIQDETASVFKDIFKGNIDSFEDMTDRMLDLFTDMMAEMAAKAVVNFVFNGSSGSAAGSILGGSGSSGGIGTTLVNNVAGEVLSPVKEYVWEGVKGLFGYGSSATTSYGVEGVYSVAGSGYSPAAATTTSSLASGAGWGTLGSTGGAIEAGTGAVSSGTAPTGMIGGAAAGAFWAVAAIVAVDLITRMTGRDPSHTNFALDAPYRMDDSYDDSQQSEEYGYRVWSHHMGDDAAILDGFELYFDSLFAALDEITTGSIKDILSDLPPHYGSSGGTGADALKNMSDDLFGEMIGDLLLDILPDAGTMDRVVERLTGREQVRVSTGRGGGEEVEFDDTGLSGRDLFDARNNYFGSTKTKRQPIYETFRDDISAMSDIFNDEFFAAITPEGGSNWDAFVGFATTVKNSSNFLVDFTRQIEEFGESTLSAYQNMQNIGIIMEGISQGVDLATHIDTSNTLSVLEQEWINLLQVLNDAHATLEDVTEAEKGRNISLGAELTGLNAASVKQTVISGGDIGSMISGAANDRLASIFVNELMDGFVTDFIEEVGAIRAEDGVEAANLYAESFDFTDINKQVDDFRINVLGLGGVIEDLAVVTADAEAAANELADAEKVLVDARDTAKSDYMTGLEKEIQILETNLNDAKSVYLDLLGEELSAQESLVSTLESAIKSIKDYRKALYIGADSPLSSSQKQEELLVRRTILQAEVISGDTDSVSDLLSVSSDYLTVTKGMSRNAVEYAREVALTNNLLEDAEVAAGDQLTEAERQVESLQNIIDEVNEVADAITDMDDARRAYEEAKTALDNNWYTEELTALQDIVLGIDELKAAYLSASAAASAAASSGGSGYDPSYDAGDPGATANRSDSPWDSNVDSVDSRLDAAAVMYESMSGGVATSLFNEAAAFLGVDSSELGSELGFTGNKSDFAAKYGFADGGILTGPASGYDVSATFHGPEAIIPLDRLDNSSLISAVKSLRQEISQLREESKAHAISLIKSSQKVERNTENLDEWNQIGMPVEQVS